MKLKQRSMPGGHSGGEIMDVKDRTVMVLGGYGEVGSAIAANF